MKNLISFVFVLVALNCFAARFIGETCVTNDGLFQQVVKSHPESFNDPNDYDPKTGGTRALGHVKTVFETNYVQLTIPCSTNDFVLTNWSVTNELLSEADLMSLSNYADLHGGIISDGSCGITNISVSWPEEQFRAVWKKEHPTVSSDLFNSLRFDVITNWTGIQFGGNEVGYVATNHVAVIYYDDATNEFLLKTTVSEIAKWRKFETRQWPSSVTNIYFAFPNVMVTNRYGSQYWLGQ